MKILFYNWVDYLDDEKRGGGVSVYQRNLIRALQAEGTECHFLCSGISYDLLAAQPRWERIKHGPAENRSRRFELVNSGVLSPRITPSAIPPRSRSRRPRPPSSTSCARTAPMTWCISTTSRACPRACCG